jgi:hypothetical protein
MNKNNEQKTAETSLSKLIRRLLARQTGQIRLHISSRTLQRWRTILPYRRIGRKYFTKESDLKKILVEAKVVSTPSPMLEIQMRV